MPRRLDEPVRCSFCGRKASEVRKLIEGPNGAYICDECVDICNEIIDEELGTDESPFKTHDVSDICCSLQSLQENSQR